jgi:putative glutamine amidotransferase
MAQAGRDKGSPILSKSTTINKSSCLRPSRGFSILPVPLTPPYHLAWFSYNRIGEIGTVEAAGGQVVSQRPIVGVATQSLEAMPGKLPPCWVMGQRYVRVLAAAGAVPWLIPLLHGDEATLRYIYDRLDALFLTGGVDVDPARYGEARHERCDRADPDRDWTEITLIRWALADGKPILGVCRGIQVINVACGGSLYQHVPEQLRSDIKHDCFPAPVASAPGSPYTRDYLAHPVRIDTGSRLGGLLGAAELLVNSMHHQGIKQMAPGLRASVYAPDGLIEGVEASDGRYLVGVQWHPEELADTHAPHRRLFTDFIAAAGGQR